MVLHPGMVRSHMIWDKIKHEFNAALFKPGAEPLQRFIHHPGQDALCNPQLQTLNRQYLPREDPAMSLRNPAGNPGVSRDTFACQLTGSPHAQEPYPVKTHLCQLIQCIVGNIIERGLRPSSLDNSVSHTLVLTW